MDTEQGGNDEQLERVGDAVGTGRAVPDKRSESANTALDPHAQKAAIWLSNLLAVGSLALSFYAKVFLDKDWMPDEWVWLLIATPYGGWLTKVWRMRHKR